MFPGDTLNDGTKLAVTHRQCFAGEFKDTVIYISPSINYAKMYSKNTEYRGKKIKTVFHCRIKPGSYKKKGKTEFKTPISPNFDNLELEWLTDDRKAVVPFGLLIGVFDS